MCEKCVRRAKTMRPTLKRGVLRWFAMQMWMHHPIPIFRSMANNIYVEAELYKLRRRKTDRSHYRRKGRRLPEE